MSVQEIKKFNDFLLYQKTKEVITSPEGKVTDEIETLIRDLKDTIVVSKGIGLAANQIGVSWKVLLVDLQTNKQTEDAPPSAGEKRPPRESRGETGKSQNQFLILLNPKIIARRGKQVIEEGCLSFPGIYLKIKRSRWVKIDGLTETEKGNQFKRITVEAEGILAQVFQHEIDHLEGKVFINRLPLWKRWKIWRQIKRVTTQKR